MTPTENKKCTRANSHQIGMRSAYRKFLPTTNQNQTKKLLLKMKLQKKPHPKRPWRSHTISSRKYANS
ncbi:MAG TPA: hypothetical protein DIU00_18865 [Phycisphaerales bacterium]|nr:hypothetical protein [Phycisphaerales bacterium]